MTFYVGLDDVHHAKHFNNSFISINRLKSRKSDIHPNNWIMDSGAFTEVSTYGTWRTEPEEYGEKIERWKACGNMVAAVTQDMMCEPWILLKTGLTVREHQQITIDRFIRIKKSTSANVMPVLQGFHIDDYLQHVDMYQENLPLHSYVGVGSVCKRNSNPEVIEDILSAIKSKRPDLKLHGFGLKITALRSDVIHGLLESSDSMAWSFSARINGRNAHDWREAKTFENRILTQPRYRKPRQVDFNFL